jgi:hypothetical protein
MRPGRNCSFYVQSWPSCFDRSGNLYLDPVLEKLPSRNVVGTADIDFPEKTKAPRLGFPPCLSASVVELNLVRDCREQLRVHQRLELLVAGFEVELHIGAVRLHAGVVHGDFFSGAGAHFLVEQPSLYQG